MLAGLGDHAWRVREMAVKVVHLRETPSAEALVPLLGDEVVRVRYHAIRALGVVGEAEHAACLIAVLQDPEVADAAEWALTTLEARLDRPRR